MHVGPSIACLHNYNMYLFIRAPKVAPVLQSIWDETTTMQLMYTTLYNVCILNRYSCPQLIVLLVSFQSLKDVLFSTE